MKNIINKLFVGTAVVLAATACTGDYIDINSNQYQPESLEADDYALASSMYNICNVVMSNDVNQYQLVESLMGCVLGGYFADGNGNFTSSFARYNPSNGWSRVLMEAGRTTIIPTLYSNYSLIEGYSTSSGNPVPLAVAKVCKVAAMSRITDTYGPIPYSKIGYDGSILTPYDSQEEVYNQFFVELTEAAQTLQENIVSKINPQLDDVYRGDLNGWYQLANSLKLRLAVRIAYANPTLAKKMAEEAVAAGCITTNTYTATYKHYGKGGNPTYSSTIGYGNDSRPAGDIISYMNGYNDPRRAKYFSTSGWVDEDDNYLVSNDGQSAEYCGVRRGWNTYDRDGWALKMSQIGVTSTDPVIWFTAAEVAFLRAEGAAVFGWDMGDTPENLYNQGITLSFEQWGVDGAAAYIADATSTPARYFDPSDANPYNGTISTITIAWDDAATTEQKQERIITQKWIANWTLGIQSWADYRRTGYPKLIPVAFNGSGGVVSTEFGPQRLPYPQEEYTNNGANVAAAVANYLNGPDNMATKLWWQKKPGL